mgnify:CR=1 FL=1
MRKAVLLFLSVMMVSVLSGCGGQKDSQGEQGGGQSQYTEALEVLNQVIEAYGEDELFAMYGGNQENAVMDGPGKFDISKAEELESVYGLGADESSNIEDAATMVHLMNANTFTGAVYRIKEGVDMDDFADALKSCILARQWICGQPDTLVLINVDGRYIITAFGEAGIIENFKTNALSALSGAQVITEAPIA